jgi:hypothetical protein
METINSLIANKFKISEDLGFELNDEMKSLSFQGLFAYLRKSLDVNYTRKLHIDSILKKCKGKFFKAVSECVRKCLKINVPKFPQTFITNIAIEYNQQFLNYTIEDLYQYFHLLPYSIDDILEKNYCVKEKSVYLKYIFLSKISTLYLQYVQSKKYKRMIELIKDKKGIKIAKLYQFVSDNFVNYYVFSKAHMKKNNFLNDGSTQNSNKDSSKNILNNTEQNNGSEEEKNF